MQVVANQEFSKAADVYSLGIILWEVMTWQMPWKDCNCFQVSVISITISWSRYCQLMNWVCQVDGRL